MSDTKQAASPESDFGDMAEADLEKHLLALSAKRDNLVAAIKDEARAARAALDAKVHARRKAEVLEAAGLGEQTVEASTAGVASTAKAGAESGTDSPTSRTDN